MSRSKKIFAAFAVIFALLLGYVVYDISSRTTFPGQSPVNDTSESKAADTLSTDSATVDQP